MTRLVVATKPVIGRPVLVPLAVVERADAAGEITKDTYEQALQALGVPLPAV